MPSAEIIAIGTELLLGEIQDTNTQFIARRLRDQNVDLYRTTIIGDNADRIAEVIRDSLHRVEIIITTGGLGPTVDDPTREAAAKAWNVALEYHPELWEQIEHRFIHRNISPSENNRRQAYLPATAIAIENPVGTAPAFILETGSSTLICLPGVPREMETLLRDAVIPFLKKKYDLHGMIKARVLHVSGVAESRVDDLVAEFETLSNPTVGLLAHPGIVDIRITAKADSEELADKMIADLEQKILLRFPADIFGADSDTLPGAVVNLIASLNVKSSWIVGGISEAELNLPASVLTALNLYLPITQNILDEYPEIASQLLNERGFDLVFYSLYKPLSNGFHNISGIITKSARNQQERIYNGPPAQNLVWAINASLDYFRRQLNQLNKG